MPPRFSGTSDLSFISSEPFVVTSGSGKRFFVHSDIMRDLHLYSGSNSKEVNLSAWSDETVGRWIQFLYAGDYRVPDLVWQEDDKAGDLKEETGEEDGEERDILRPMSGRPGSITPYIQGLAAQEESLNVLLLHAGLYVLACSFGPDALEVISFDRLSSALEYTGSAVEEGNSAAAIGFVELVDYICCVMTDTLDGRIKLGTKGLDLVRNFAVKHFGTLMARAEMSSLMRKRGVFAVQLMEMVANKVRVAESDAKKWKDKARLFESALEKSTSDSKKTQQSEIRKFFQVWISRRPKEILSHSHSQPFDLDNDALYRYDSISLKKMKNLDSNLTRLHEAHPDWTHEFESSRSREIRDSTDLEAEIASYLDYCFPISLKLQTDLENYPRLREFETSEAARSLREKIAARNEVQTIIPIRLQELVFLETAHKYRWLNNTCRTLHITFYDRMCFDILVHRAAWIDNRVERMEYEINWIMKQVEDSNVGGFSDINLRD